MCSVVLREMVRVTARLPASPGQTHAAEYSCFANMAVILCSGGAPALFPAYISRAHGESRSQGEIRREAFFTEEWQVQVENNDQVTETLS